jgi:hypothetical protein
MKKRAADAVPAARKDGLVMRELGGEVLIYDLTRHKAFCLNQTAAMIWKRCNGRSTAADVAKSIGKEIGARVDEQVVWMALDRLEKSRLLDGKIIRSGALLSASKRESRREALKKIGLTAAIALPAVTSIIAPTAANAQTAAGVITPAQCKARNAKTTGCGGTPCTTGGNCVRIGNSANCKCA